MTESKAGQGKHKAIPGHLAKGFCKQVLKNNEDTSKATEELSSHWLKPGENN